MSELKYTLPALIPVVSSNVQEIGYQQDSQTLYVRFKNGSLYAYSGVEESVFEELRTAKSVGSYLAHLKKRYLCIVIGK